MDDLPTYHEVEDLYYKTSNTISHRHHLNEQLNGLPLLASLISTSSMSSETHALNKIYSKNYEPKNTDYWKKLEINIELADNATFSQGDCVKGRFFISNKSATVLPYILCSVALMGRISTDYRSEMKIKHCSIQNFLLMIDHGATSELKDIHSNYTIPLRSDNRKCIMPFTTYSNSFNFKIPDTLLSCVCNSHEVMSHCNLLPSIYSQRSTRCHSNLIEKKTNFMRIRKVIDMNITYNIEVSIIGKLSDYKKNITNDSNVLIVKETKDLLIVPRTDIVSPKVATNDTGYEYRELIEKIKKIIDKSKITKHSQKDEAISKESILMQNNYSDRNIDTQNVAKSPQSFHSYVKRLFYWYKKYKGDFKIQVPNQVIFFDISSGYFYSFSNRDVLCTTCFKIPIELEIIGPFYGFKFSKIEKVSSELIGLTFISKHSRIPIRIGYDLLFGSKIITDIKDFNPLEENIKKPLRQLLKEIMTLKLKPSEYSLIADLQCLVNLVYKCESFKIPTTNPDIVYWKLEEKSYPNNRKANFNIFIEGDIIKSIFQSSKLDQDFQSCHMGKIYYIKLSIKLHCLGNIYVNVPINFKNIINICP